MKKVAKVVGGIGIAASALCTAASYITFNEVMNRDAKLFKTVADAFTKKQNANVEPTPPDERIEWFDKQTFERFSLVNDSGNTLAGFLLPAENPTDVFVFFSHGYRSSGKGEFSRIVKFYHDKGFNVFLVDHQAAGESEGKYISFGYYECRDCLKWLHFLKEKFGSDIQIIIHGNSMGSATVMMMCGSPDLPDNVKFAVADCGYTGVLDEFRFNLHNCHVPDFPVLYGANFFNRHICGFDFKDVSPLESVKHAKVPMLFVHGGADDFVPTEMCGKLFDACASEEKDMLIVDGAWHVESYPKGSSDYEAKLCSFIEKFIKVPVTV